VRLTVTDKKGQTAWCTKSVTVASGPTALFTWTVGAPPSSVVTVDASQSFTAPPATIKEYQWYVNGSLAAFGIQKVVTLPLATGTYQVRLVVIDSRDLQSESTQTVTVQ
jgi:hypothetical protein